MPKYCSVCGKFHGEKGHICAECMKEVIKYSHGSKCIRCGRTVETGADGICSFCKRVKPEFDIAFAVFPYKDMFKQAIRALKFEDEYYRIAGMTELLAEAFLKHNLKADCVIYVPSDIRAFFGRKYCLPQELAYGLAKKFRLPLYKGFLFKTPGRKSQSLVEFEKRYTNVRGAFGKNTLNFSKLKGKSVLLVDDVITTGSTLSECSAVLKLCGAKNVYGVALAYGSSK